VVCSSFSSSPAKKAAIKRPFVAVVAGYTAGLLLAEIFQPRPAALFAATFVLLVLLLLREKLRSFMIWPLLALIGWTNLASRTAVISPDDLRALIGNATAIAAVRGTLAETPHIKITEREGEQSEHSLAQVRVNTLQLGENRLPALGGIVVSTPAPLAETFFAGQAVEISGVIARPAVPLAEGLFDYRNYLQTRGIYYELKTNSTNDWQLREPSLASPPLTDRFLNWSKRTLALGLPAEDEPLRLLWAMTLGWRAAFTGNISEPFLRVGENAPLRH
jgi:hypothetical protein